MPLFFSFQTTATDYPLKDVESQFSWIEDSDLLSGIHTGLLDHHATMKSYVESLISSSYFQNQMKAEDGEDNLTMHNSDDEIEMDDKNITFGFLSRELNSAAMEAYIGNFSVAGKYLAFAISKLEFLEPRQERRREAVNYLIDALLWSIDFWEKNSKIAQNEDCSNLELDDRRLSELKKGYKQVVSNKEGKAVIQFFRASMGVALHVSGTKSLEQYEAIVKLDPEYYGWYYDVYRTLRSLRRNEKRQETNCLLKPCKKERWACKMAYKLAPDDCGAIVNYATMIKETFWVRSKKYWDVEGPGDSYMESIELFQKALTIATETGRKKWVRKTKLYLGEMLLFGKGKKLDQLEGKKLFDELERDYPNSSQIFHKIGKLLQHGAHATRKFQDKERAKEVFRKALKLNPQNVPCLLDYTKLVKGEINRKPPIQRQRHFHELLEVYDECLTQLQKDHEIVFVMSSRAYILFLLNTTKRRLDAIDGWLCVLKTFPDFESRICKMIKEPWMDCQKFPVRISLTVLLQDLQKMKTEAEKRADNASTVQQISHFMDLLNITTTDGSGAKSD